MKRIFALLLCIGIAAVFAACGSNGENATPDSASSNSSSIHPSNGNNVIDPNETFFTIETEYADLSYPEKWQKKVSVEVSKDKVSFSTADKKVKLFDLCFGGKDGYVIGDLNDKKTAELRAVSYNIDSKVNNFDECCAMQEDMNVIIQKLINEGKLVEK